MRNHDKLIAEHCAALVPQHVKDLIDLAVADLYHGPPYPGGYEDRAEELSLENPEQYKGYDFTRCCKEIDAWADDNLPSRLWIDSQSEFVEDSDPTVGAYAEECERDGCPILPEDFYLYDSVAIRRAVFGTLAEYL